MVVCLSGEKEDEDSRETVKASEDPKDCSPGPGAFHDVASKGRTEEWSDQESGTPDVDHARPVLRSVHVMNDG